jgi:hypothetical protein
MRMTWSALQRLRSFGSASGQAFARLPRYAQSLALSGLRRLSKGITISPFSTVFRRDYSFIRIEFPPLTSKLKYDILLALLGDGGKQIEPPSYRKEEVMSQMDSSNKPSAVASLLK